MSIELDRVLVVDDQSDSRESSSLSVEDADLLPVPVEGPLGSLEDFSEVPQDRTGAICDFELRAANYANFHGAQLVRAWYHQHLPAVLCTRYEKAQLDAIRPYRRWVPVMLTPSELNADSLMQGLELALGEFVGNFSPERRPHRALVRIVDVGLDEGRAFTFELPGWPSDLIFKYPLISLAPDIRGQIAPEFRTHVQTNLGCEVFEDLYFTSWGHA